MTSPQPPGWHQPPPPPAPPPKKSFVPWLVGAVVLLAPGAITFSFAMGEATDFGSDWVKISLPLLLVAGGLLVVAAHRAAKVAGLVVGIVVVLGGLGAALSTLASSIGERVAWQESSRALRDTERFCEGRGAPDPRARRYDPKRPGRHPAVVHVKGSFAASGSYEERKVYRDLEPSRFQIEDAELVACVVEKPATLETCNYSEGAKMDRVRLDLEVKLFAIATGEQVFATTLAGETPRGCQMTEEFYGKDGKLGSITGKLPPHADVAKALAPHVETK